MSSNLRSGLTNGELNRLRCFHCLPESPEDPKVRLFSITHEQENLRYRLWSKTEPYNFPDASERTRMPFESCQFPRFHKLQPFSDSPTRTQWHSGRHRVLRMRYLGRVC